MDLGGVHVLGACLAPDDAWVAAQACRALRDAARAQYPRGWRTPAAGATSSLERLAHARACGCTSRPRALAYAAARRGLPDVVEAASPPTDSVSVCAGAAERHEWATLRWCVERGWPVNRQTAAYARHHGHADTCPQRMPAIEEFRPRHAVRAPDYQTIIEAACRFGCVAAVMQQTLGVVSGAMRVLQPTHSAGRWLCGGTFDVLTSIRPLGRYRVRVEVGGSTVSPAHVPMAALQFNQAHVVFDFDGPEPDDYGVSYVGWILSPADRRRLTQGVQCGADLYSGLGVHWLCLDDRGPGRPWRLTSVNES